MRKNHALGQMENDWCYGITECLQRFKYKYNDLSELVKELGWEKDYVGKYIKVIRVVPNASLEEEARQVLMELCQ